MSQRRVLLAFGGQGSQFTGMAAPFLARPAFRSGVAACSATYSKHGAPFSISEAMEECKGVEVTEVGQPLVAALQISSARLLDVDGEVSTIGHSLGEVAAAHVAGLLTVDEAMAIVYFRSQVLSKVFGAMAVVRGSLEKVLDGAGLDPAVSVAGVNAFDEVTLSGPREAIEAIAGQLKRRRLISRPIPVSYAFHSSLITDRHVEDLRTHLKAALPCGRRLSGPFFPTALLTEDELRSAEARDLYRARFALGVNEVDYWANQIRNPVCFAHAAEVALETPYDAIYEVSPRATLNRYLKAVAQPRTIDVKQIVDHVA
eukprot:Sspe_Gene.114440::Locus_99987_Transcript_1_1_Confidence_1.000_Length_1034::g.114440::m.114440